MFPAPLYGTHLGRSLTVILPNAEGRGQEVREELGPAAMLVLI